MTPHTDQQVLDAFRKLGLGTDEERASFKFPGAIPTSKDEKAEFIRLDTETQVAEVEHAELA